MYRTLCLWLLCAHYLDWILVILYIHSVDRFTEKDKGNLTYVISLGKQPAQICFYFGSCRVIQLQRYNWRLHTSSSSSIIVTSSSCASCCCCCPSPGAVPASTRVHSAGQDAETKITNHSPRITSSTRTTTTWAWLTGSTCTGDAINAKECTFTVSNLMILPNLSCIRPPYMYFDKCKYMHMYAADNQLMFTREHRRDAIHKCQLLLVQLNM